MAARQTLYRASHECRVIDAVEKGLTTVSGRAFCRILVRAYKFRREAADPQSWPSGRWRCFAGRSLYRRKIVAAPAPPQAVSHAGPSGGSRWQALALADGASSFLWFSRVEVVQQLTAATPVATPHPRRAVRFFKITASTGIGAGHSARAGCCRLLLRRLRAWSARRREAGNPLQGAKAAQDARGQHGADKNRDQVASGHHRDRKQMRATERAKNLQGLQSRQATRAGACASTRRLAPRTISINASAEDRAREPRAGSGRRTRSRRQGVRREQREGEARRSSGALQAVTTNERRRLRPR